MTADRGTGPGSTGKASTRELILDTAERLFADDPVALGIIDALGEGLAPEQIRESLSLTKTEYDSARKRMGRCLLREGLTCRPK